MKSSSGTRAFVRIFSAVLAIVAMLGYYSHVRAQSGTGSVIVPLRPLAPLSSVPIPPVFGIEGILADKQSAIQLGKALFWDMQAGSDDVQACASCHFNAGADSRATNDVNPGQPGGDNSFQLGMPIGGSKGPNYHYKGGSANAGFGGYHDGDFPFHKVSNPNDRFTLMSDVNDVSGSQGVFGLTEIGISIPQAAGTTTTVTTGGGNPVGSTTGGTNDSFGSADISPAHEGGAFEDGSDGGDDANFMNGPRTIRVNGLSRIPSRRAQPQTTQASPSAILTTVLSSDPTSTELISLTGDPVFSYPDPANAGQLINTRRITGRNTPSVVNAVFNFRNFWDGRAQNVCNGANPFGARDKQAHLLVADGADGKVEEAIVGMQNSALCSQSLGPILSSTEMSAANRDFRQVGRKLLARKPLAKQLVDPTDSVLGGLSNSPNTGIGTTYSALIQKAFQPEWWQFNQHVCVNLDGTNAGTVDPTSGAACPSGTLEYSLMEYNFSLFWGVAIQMYESTLVSDQTPLDKYLEGQQSYTLVGDNVKNQYTIQLSPNVTPYSVSVIGLNPTLDASDQDMYAFDDGQGNIRGVGVNSGTINYATGSITIYFGEPPVSQVPVNISYSVGATTPLTQAQLRGLNVFQTKGECVVCHGGPELSNAAVGTVSAVPSERMIMEDESMRVYDTGFYHIGIRPTAEDAGLAGTDPVANLPLSNSEYLRQNVCNGGFETVIVPGRRGDGIAPSPLNCNDDIARGGFFKVPQLRNVALTAPYFHNGGQLTLEQVVEYYNRGGDFNTFSEVKYMDPDVEILGLTLQDKEDLVDFLRNGLTDQRTVKQSAPFDHPQLFTPNGHAVDGNGYPVMNDPQHPGQAVTILMEVPAVGATGGAPLPSFLQNVLGTSAPASTTTTTISTPPAGTVTVVPVNPPANTVPANPPSQPANVPVATNSIHAQPTFAGRSIPADLSRPGPR
jgi:cytochrome c peroxidase